MHRSQIRFSRHLGSCAPVAAMACAPAPDSPLNDPVVVRDRCVAVYRRNRNIGFQNS
jgi:hypothetical protein